MGAGTMSDAARPPVGVGPGLRLPEARRRIRTRNAVILSRSSPSRGFHLVWQEEISHVRVNWRDAV